MGKTFSELLKAAKSLGSTEVFVPVSITSNREDRVISHSFGLMKYDPVREDRVRVPNTSSTGNIPGVRGSTIIISSEGFFTEKTDKMPFPLKQTFSDRILDLVKYKDPTGYGLPNTDPNKPSAQLFAVIGDLAYNRSGAGVEELGISIHSTFGKIRATFKLHSQGNSTFRLDFTQMGNLLVGLHKNSGTVFVISFGEPYIHRVPD